MWIRKSRRGSVAVLLTSVLLSVFTAVAVLIEAASVTAASGAAEAIAELSGRSVLAQYHRELQTGYGIFANHLLAEQIEEELSYFMGAAFKEKPDKGRGLIRLGSGSAEVDLSEHSLLRPDLLELQILAYMKYRAPLSLLGIGSDSKGDSVPVGGAIAGTNSSPVLPESLSGMGESYPAAAAYSAGFASVPDDGEYGNELLQDLSTVGAVDRLTDFTDPVYRIYGEMLKEKAAVKPLWEKWQKMLEQGGEDDGYEERLRKQEQRIAERLERVKDLARDCRAAVSDFEGELHSLKAEGYAGTGMVAQIEEIKAETELYLKLTPSTLSFHDSEETDIDHQNDLFSNLEKRKGEYEQYLQGDDGEGENGFESGSETKGERSLLNERILSGLPSALHGNKGIQLPDFSGLNSFKDIATAGRNTLYTNAYISSMFRHHLTEESEETFFRNEIEYILSGKASDKANRKRVEALLFTLRCSSNLAHIYSSSEKRMEVSLLAAALTPGPAAPLTQGVLSSIWAAAEAKIDLDCLLGGGRVPLLKDNSSWRLSLDAALNGAVSQGAFGEERGLSYGDYLDLFLLLKNREEKLIRVMDLIQINIKGRYDGQFLIKNCHVGFTADLTVSRQSLFAQWESRFTTKKFRQVHIY